MGKFRHGVEQADAAYLASIATYDDVLVTMVGDVASDCVQIRTIQAQIAIARDNVVKQKGALDIASDRYKGGATSELDVFQAQNVLGQTEAAIPQLTAQLQQTENALAVLLGLPPASDRRASRPLARYSRAARATPRSACPPICCAVAPTCARRSSRRRRRAPTSASPRPTLSGLLARRRARHAGVSTTNGGKIGQLFTSPSITFAFGPSFSSPVLNYGQITNQVRAEDAELQALLIDYKNVVLKAQQEVDSGLAGFVEGRQQVAYLRRSARAANSALTVAIAQYQLGSRDFTTVLTAEQNLYQAQNNLAAAEGGVSVSLTTAYRALGGGWQIRDGHDFVNDATRDEMRARTNYGDILPPAGQPQPQAPGLPGPSDLGPTVRPPQW